MQRDHSNNGTVLTYPGQSVRCGAVCVTAGRVCAWVSRVSLLAFGIDRPISLDNENHVIVSFLDTKQDRLLRLLTLVAGASRRNIGVPCLLEGAGLHVPRREPQPCVWAVLQEWPMIKRDRTVNGRRMGREGGGGQSGGQVVVRCGGLCLLQVYGCAAEHVIRLAEGREGNGHSFDA